MSLKFFTIFGHGDSDHLNKLSFSYLKETPCEIWPQSAEWLFRKRSLKILNLRDLDQGQSVTLTFGTHKESFMYSFS